MPSAPHGGDEQVMSPDWRKANRAGGSPKGSGARRMVRYVDAVASGPASRLGRGHR